MKSIQISSENLPSRQQIEAMARLEGIYPAALWMNKRLVCSYLITFSIANVSRNLKDGEKALIKFPAGMEFLVEKDNGKVKINRERLAQKLDTHLKDFPLSQILELAG